jgi:hypothetical protein
MRKFRSFFTVLFLLSSLIVILFIAIYDNPLLIRVADEIRNYIGPSFIALLVLLVLISSAIVSNSAKSFGSLIANGYFQLAVLELFLFSAALAYYHHYFQQPAQMIIRLQPEQIKDSIRLGIKNQSMRSLTTDTIIAPTEIHNLFAGNYSLEILDKDIVYFHTDVTLKPAETEIIIIPVALNFKTIAIQTEPTGAEILIDGVFTSKSPDTLEIYNRDTVMIELKMQGYQSYKDTIALTANIDLGVITLLKLYSLRILCYLEGMGYKIYDKHKRIVFTANRSQKLQLPQGRYKISYQIGEGQIATKNFVLNYNSTIEIPYQ